ncbi:MAG: hypothetical protein AB4911_12265, partial [Oscillochloridaceae bacterium umkhey_bin13]
RRLLHLPSRFVAHCSLFRFLMPNVTTDNFLNLSPLPGVVALGCHIGQPLRVATMGSMARCANGMAWAGNRMAWAGDGIAMAGDRSDGREM